VKAEMQWRKDLEIDQVIHFGGSHVCFA